MGAIRGSMTFKRYRTSDGSGELPKDPRARFLRGLRAHVFLPIDPDSDAERSVGWVSVEDSEDTDLTMGKVFFGERLLVALRVDLLRPPAGEVKREVQRRERDNDKPLTKGERKALKAEVIRKLRKRTFVRTRTFDVVWSPDRGRLYFFAQAKAANETFIAHFATTFGVAIEPEGPAVWSAAAPRGAKKQVLEPSPELMFGFGRGRKEVTRG